MSQPPPVVVTLADGTTPATLHPGCEYVIRYRLHGQGFDREARMSFLGGEPHALQWNARPAAGTQELPARVLTGVWCLGASAGRDDPRRYVGRDARRQPDPQEIAPARCGHQPYGDTGHCAHMTCAGYISRCPLHATARTGDQCNLPPATAVTP